MTFSKPKFHLIFLTVLLLVVFIFWSPQHGDDGLNFQQFAVKVVDEGKIDLSIPGFHGTDFLVSFVYWITGSEWSVYFVDMIAALLLIPVIYLFVKKLYGKESLALVAAYIYVLMPFDVFNALRGGHQTLHFLLTIWALYLLFSNKNWSWVIMGLSYITRPFSVVFAPFYIYKKKYKQLILGFIFPVVYVAAQYLQISKVMIGQHPELTVQKLFNVKRFFMNLVYMAQNYLSIHNFSPYNPLYQMDMVHLSPLITVMAIIGIFYCKKFFNNQKLFYTLISIVALAYLLPCSFYRVDMWYFGTFNLALIFLALPIIEKYHRLIPFIAASFAFQFYYFFLSYGHIFYWAYIVFLIPLAVFIVSIFYARHLELKQKTT